MPAELNITRHDSTLVLTLNDPASRNALSPAVYAAAVAALDDAAHDPTLRAIVLTGAGGHFSGGGNLHQLAAVRGQPEVQAARVDALHGYGPMLLAGAEIIRLVTNPAFEVQHKVRTYHYMPKGGQTDYREHH